jgi:hypothetical protein
VQQQGWHANLIEVGSIRRGLVGLPGHLFLLDYLWSSGFPLCGVGVTDAHGGLLLKDPRPGVDEDQYNFVTWIGGVDRSASGAQLIDALRSCNTSFGDPFYTRGGLWLDLSADSTGRQMVVSDAGGVTSSADLYLFEAEVDSTGVGHDPVYRRSGQRIGRTDPISVGGCRAGFARVEAWAQGRPIAFSNVVTLAAVPAMCAASSRSR